MDALHGRTAVVTGGAGGIGAAVARELARRGARVVVADIDGAGADALAAQLDDARGATVDVGDETSLRAMLDGTVEREGAIDILVNNAARTVVRPFWEIGAQEWDAVMAVNLRSVFLGCRIAGEHMRERGSGRIVNLASLAGQQGGVAGGAHYAASKAGIIVLTKIVAAELAPHGVTVNAVAPAAIEGPAMDALPPDRVMAFRARIPVGRLGRPEEVAAAVAYLASDEAAFVTGATLDLNGGLHMR
jgi:3-oxoacyl-[acyl-carrier protein] reductase